MMIMFSLVLSACGGSATEAPAPEEPVVEEPVVEEPAAEEPAAENLPETGNLGATGQPRCLGTNGSPDSCKTRMLN